MPSNFAEVGKQLQTTIPVPELPGASIRNRLRGANARHRSRVLIASTLAAIVVLGSGSVLAAMINGGVRIWLSGNKGAVAIHSFATISNPTAAELRRVVAGATFPVVLPAGVPAGMHLSRLVFSPVDRPNFILVQYLNGKNMSALELALVDSSVVEGGAVPAFVNGEKSPVALVVQWNVGRETVIISDPFQFARKGRFEAAMLGVTPAESFAATLPRLYRITVLGGLFSLADVADTIAPVNGRSILVDRGNLGQVADLAQERKPLFVTRTTRVDNIPTVSGKPDLGHASSHPDKEIAVSVDGVRAIAAVLASNVCGSAGKMGSGFTCEMLINERSGRAYWIWVLPVNASSSPTKYIVDATTFHVSRAR